MKAIIRRFIRILFQRLPTTWQYKLRRDRYSSFEKRPEFKVVRHDLCRITLTEKAFIDVFWKALPIGRGPAASVVIQDQEILKFDCFGAGKGHLHALVFQTVPAPEQRLFFSETTIADQIERSVFEVTRNLYYYTQRSPYAEVRKFRINDILIQQAGEQMRQKMINYIVNSTE